MFQTRDYDGDIREHATLKEAMDYANANYETRKVSFDAFNGDRVRLVNPETVVSGYLKI